MSGGRRAIIVSYSLDVVRQNEDTEHWVSSSIKGRGLFIRSFAWREWGKDAVVGGLPSAP